MMLHKFFAIIVLLMCVATAASSKIVFNSNMDGNYEIYVMDDDGTNVQRLTHHPDKDKTPRWSPDGKQIAFTREKRWEPGQKLQQLDVFIMNKDSSQLQQITDHPGLDVQPEWSPDGKYIAFLSSRSGDWNIYKIDLATRDITQLTENPGGITINLQGWSPDGKQVAYTVSYNTLYLTDADGRGHQLFLPRKGKEYFSFRWSPDGNEVLYSEAAYHENNLISNKLVFRTKSGRWIKEIDMTRKWFMHDVRWMQGKHLMITAEEWPPPRPQPRQPTEIYHYTIATGQMTNLTNLPSTEGGADWIDDSALVVLPAGTLSILWGQLKEP